MKTYKYLTIKCNPNLFEEKLNDFGAEGYKYLNTIVINEEKIINIENDSFVTKQRNEIVTLFLMTFEKEILCKE